ncbi:single-stranded DNA-binding protein [Pseudoleptotrichia goodfellowii]|jgi:single-strand binding protein|uniref:Single-stranded DNA-binding protein n=2 Tax=Pseudoleptotrichia goodfellowii TaxID=157692 RepID=D0GIJ6_9FUSO|nr:single-stranded DNA-binding protein [Pseudoleptotrichia goodfellowii]EEY36093.1 single-strand binding family protein [Pseudoleptotrichia goodfellowii F0264]MBF4805127.1 single-stranded DNA-binding protein [Pseudoleptotrichia goodfellowii]BBM37252.1 single-stranded DNA-binding protein [Pseudoleptotrichia goodfellowii]
MNQVLLIGRLTKDPELKYSQSGKAFCRFSIAVTKEFNRNETDFFDCVAWNKTAEIIAEYMRKGKKIAIQGRLETGSYEKEGRNIKTYSIIVDKFEFVDSAGGQGQQQSSSYSQGTQPKETFADNDNDEIMDDDDFPF